VKKLYIGNLPFSATEDQLNEWFSQIGVTPSGGQSDSAIGLRDSRAVRLRRSDQ